MQPTREFEKNQFGLVVDPLKWEAYVNRSTAEKARANLAQMRDPFRTHSGEDILTFEKGIVCPVSLSGEVREGSILAQLGSEAIKTFKSLLSAGALEPSKGTIRTVGTRVVAFLPTRGTQGQVLPLEQMVQGMAGLAQVASRSKDPLFRLALPMLATGGNELDWHKISKDVRAAMVRYPVFSDLYLVSIASPLFRQGASNAYMAGVMKNL